jgi:hypothetical protein
MTGFRKRVLGILGLLTGTALVFGNGVYVEECKSNDLGKDGSGNAAYDMLESFAPSSDSLSTKEASACTSDLWMGQLGIQASRTRTTSGSVHQDQVLEIFMDWSITFLDAGTATLDGEELTKWADSSFGTMYMWTHGDGFRFALDHLYTFAVTGSEDVPAFSDTVTSLNKDVRIASPLPGSVIRRSQGLHVTWQPQGDSISVSLADADWVGISYEGIDTGSVYFSPTRLESLRVGIITLSVFRSQVSVRDYGYPFTVMTSVQESVEFELSAAVEEDRMVLERSGIRQHGPNPFSSSTSLKYELSRSANVSIEVFNSAGQVVSIIPCGRQNSGTYITTWQGTDDNGRKLDSGIYFSRLLVDGKKCGQVTKIIVTR